MQSLRKFPPFLQAGLSLEPGVSRAALLPSDACHNTAPHWASSMLPISLATPKEERL